MNLIFRNRSDAGRRLAAALEPKFGEGSGVRVFGLPRGGVPVAHEIAQALKAPLDVLIVRKLGWPKNPELAIGAIAGNNVMVLNHQLITELDINQVDLDALIAAETQELQRRESIYRRGRPALDIAGRAVILVDDGLATGMTMQAAVMVMKKEAPASITIAIPVAAPDVCAKLRGEIDELICLSTPFPFQAVGVWYRDFTQTEDAVVLELLGRP